MRTVSCKEKQDVDFGYGLVYNGVTDDIRRQVYGCLLYTSITIKPAADVRESRPPGLEDCQE